MDAIALQTALDDHAAANALWDAGKPGQALALFERAVAALPSDAPPDVAIRARSDHALCLRELGHTKAALALYPQIEALCLAAGADPTSVLRQWAIALEQDRDFAAARALYDRIRPAPDAPSLDRLLWHHAVGLLCWSEGRLAEAVEHLSAASDAMPRDPQVAGRYLAVLGNDAQLSLMLGRDARAYRLVSRMRAIRAAVAHVPLACETSLAIAHAALVTRRGDHAQAARILADCLDWMTLNDPAQWMHRLDMAARYVDAACAAGPSAGAVATLTALCDAAPADKAWIASMILVPALLDLGDLAAAHRHAVIVVAALVGQGPQAAEAEIVAVLAALAHGAGQPDAAIFLGKLALGYLAEMMQTLDPLALDSVVADSDRLLALTRSRLRAAGRYQEAALLADVANRVRRSVVMMRKPLTQALGHDAVPLDRAETVAKGHWLAGRQALCALRAAGREAEVMTRAAALVDDLLAVRSTSGLGRKRGLLPPPGPGVLRIGLLALGDSCELHCQWHDRVQIVPVDRTPAQVSALVSDLRDAASDPLAWRAPAMALHDLLIRPIADALDGLSVLEVDAAGLLGRIPMGLLTDGARCLVQRVAIRCVVAVDAPPPPTAPRAGLAHLAAFGTGPLARLPGRLDAVAGALTPLTAITGGALTRDALRAALDDRPALLSLAAHLDVAPTRPDLSSLLLGDGTDLHLADLAGGHFDLDGVQVALIATCASAMDDPTQDGDTSLAALLLEKGVAHCVGTIWDLSETAAATMIAAFWQARARDPAADPACLLAEVQAACAARLLQPAPAGSRAGGIGGAPRPAPPADWAGFACFAPCNPPQPGPRREAMESASLDPDHERNVP